MQALTPAGAAGRVPVVTCCSPPLLPTIGDGAHRRNTMDLLSAEGYTCYAPDWIGHGDSDKPAAGGQRRQPCPARTL
jgi:pimeloyl-ACP methyl ester carboxylesterase